MGTSRIILAVSLTAGLLGCQTPSASLETGAGSSSAALTLGLPCSAAGDCTSGFCVDGVCCDTACGGGVRDRQTCSDIYGAVTGLTNGTCTPLTAGEPCGAITSVNPCTWRGSTVNGGGQCPNPPGTSVACFPCTAPADCSGAFPVCVSGACVACSGDFGSGASAACPNSAPVCTNGQCGGCAGCGGTTPACNELTSTCSACNGNYGSGATLPCASAAAPACLATGACAQCTAADTSACSGTTPACDTGSNTCAGCNGDYGSVATRACSAIAAPLCLSSGACGKCTSSGDCSGSDICNTALGNCGAPCADDTACTAREWCATGVCTPKLPNGSALPSLTPIGGACTTANGARVCVSGVCSTADQRCGLPNTASCGPPAQAAECRSGTCFAGDNLCGLPTGQTCTADGECRSSHCAADGTCGDCLGDADCGGASSGMVCDAVDLRCRPGCRGTGGNGCAAGASCTSTDARIGTCAQCLSDADCGGATSGQVCTEDYACAPGCRGDGGNGCGGGTVCTSGDGSVGSCVSVEGGGPSCASSGDGLFSTAALVVIAIAVTMRLRGRRS